MKDFDPFGNRMSRDLRNSLSTALIRSLNDSDSAGFETAAANWLTRVSGSGDRLYIEDRLARYRAVYGQITGAGHASELHRVAVLWNRHLFFEVHEQLEESWHTMRGDRREATRGLILAAGVYVHLGSGRQPAAEGLARRAAELLQKHSEYFKEIANLDEVIAGLERVDPDPPVIRIRSVSNDPSIATD